MCDEFVCSDSGVVSLCDDDRRLLASLGVRRGQEILSDTDSKEKEKEKERADNNNEASETNRNITADITPKTDDQGTEADWKNKSLPSGAAIFLCLS